jgi:DNA repair exonuclease SbcCD ATPase subunit
MRWMIEEVCLHDFLGFQGEHKEVFDRNIGVIFANNNTGKSSLALGIQWALTGRTPKLRGVNKTSFKLVNRHAGDGGNPSVKVTLVNEKGKKMVVTRRGYKDGKISKIQKENGLSELEVEIDGKLINDVARANQKIHVNLGVNQRSLLGCGVILQQHILELISGKSSQISEVLNDTLGLITLSKLCPLLEGKSNEAKKKEEEIGNKQSPAENWETVNDTLCSQIDKAENRALKEGIPKDDVEDPKKAINRRIGDIAEKLNLDVDLKDPKHASEKCRGEIEKQRRSSPWMAKKSKIEDNIRSLERDLKDITTWTKKWNMHQKAFTKIAKKGKIKIIKIQSEWAGLNEKFEAAKREKVERLEDKKFLEQAYSHLKSHHDEDSCPLCEKKQNLKKLIEKVELKIGEEASQGITNTDNKIKSAKRKLVKSKRAKELAEKFVGDKHEDYCEDLQNFIGEISTSQKIKLGKIDSDRLLLGTDSFEMPLEILEKAQVKILESKVSLDVECKDAKEKLSKSEENLEPLENSIRIISEHLQPLKSKSDEIEDHRKAKGDFDRREKILGEKKERAGTLVDSLNKIIKDMNGFQLDRANSAIKPCQKQMNELFQKIAANPDYDRLEVKAEIKRDKVQYDLTASSSKLSSLGDRVGHVLSEGNLTAASLSLLLSLIKGDKHRLGFLLLDDPGQGFDDDTMERFARTITEIKDVPQMVVLTHQEKLASVLEENGAVRRDWGRWEGGRIHGS